MGLLFPTRRAPAIEPEIDREAERVVTDSELRRLDNEALICLGLSVVLDLLGSADEPLIEELAQRSERALQPAKGKR